VTADAVDWLAALSISAGPFVVMMSGGHDRRHRAEVS
jgi:hypothetical protein